jgi:putative DNA primase/helicase
LAVATALRERYKDKPIIIAGDDYHRPENNPGRAKAIEVAAAVKGFALFPNLTAKEKELGLTDFNDLAIANPRLAKHQLEEALRRARQQGEEQTGQIKTSEDRSREQDAGADNEMDGEDAIKLYNELVKSPGDRRKLFRS